MLWLFMLSVGDINWREDPQVLGEWEDNEDE